MHEIHTKYSLILLVLNNQLFISIPLIVLIWEKKFHLPFESFNDSFLKDFNKVSMYCFNSGTTYKTSFCNTYN